MKAKEKQVSHTPGPWSYIQDPRSGFKVLVGKPHAAEDVLQVGWGGGGKSIRLRDEANARLIAAAPELLEACGGVLIMLNDCGYGGSNASNENRDIKRLTIAIAKATGGQSDE